MTRVNDEASQRRALSAAHRLTARNRWDDLIFTLLSARVPGEDERLLVSPFPGMCGQVTASSLVKVDLAGKPVMTLPSAVHWPPVHGWRDTTPCWRR